MTTRGSAAFREVEVLIIGAGAFGSSIAFHLAKLGREVVLAEKSLPGLETTARTAAQAMEVHADDNLSRIGIRSIEMMLRYEDELGEPLTLNRVGSIKIARREEDVPQLEDEVLRGKDLGARLDFITAGEVVALAPWVDPRDALRVWYAERDLYTNADELLGGYVRAAERLGASVFTGCDVTAISRGEDGFAVESSCGLIRAQTVVNAAGAWAAKIGKMVGTRPPFWPVRHQVVVTEPIAGVHPMQPSVRIIDAKTYVRPEGNGLMMGGYERTPFVPTEQQLAQIISIDDLPLDEAPLREKIDAIAAQFPTLAAAPIARIQGGLPTMTPDGNFLIDEAPEVPGFITVGGCCVAGLSTSPAVGADVAEWIDTGIKPPDLVPFNEARLEDARYHSQETLRLACASMYSDKYSYDELRQH